MNPIYLMLYFILIHAPEHSLGRRGRKPQRQKNQILNDRKKEKLSRDMVEETTEQNNVLKNKGSSISLEIIEAMNPELYKLPKDCSSVKEISSYLKRCITIWQNFCRCAECKGSTCGEVYIYIVHIQNYLDSCVCLSGDNNLKITCIKETRRYDVCFIGMILARRFLLLICHIK